MYRSLRRMTCCVYRSLSTRLSLALSHPLSSGGLQIQDIASAAQPLQVTAALLQRCRHLNAHQQTPVQQGAVQQTADAVVSCRHCKHCRHCCRVAHRRRSVRWTWHGG